MGLTILVIDDHQSTRETVSEVIRREGHRAITAADARSAVKLFREERPDIVLADYRLPDGDGLQVLREIKQLDRLVPVVMITGHGDDSVATQAMLELGARDYITKPIDLERLRLVIRQSAEIRELQRKNTELQRKVEEQNVFQEFVGQSPEMRRIFAVIRQIAPTSATVFIRGENGTGKELVANAIHALSDRADKPFIKLAIAALPADLLESELFGHEKGAFTGAHKRRIGRFELADGGTLFLDEIGEMPVETQMKLLRVIETRRFERVGGNETLEADIRLICATNRDIDAAMKEGRFRQDLFFRINVIPIELPPLRERKSDIPLLAKHFFRQFAGPGGAEMRFSQEAMAILLAYDWPGNVRELRNLVERVSIQAPGGVIGPELLPEPLAPKKPRKGGRRQKDEGTPLGAMEKQIVESTLSRVKGNKSRAARELGLSPKTLTRKMRKYGLDK